MDKICSNPDLPSFHLKERKEAGSFKGSDGIYANTEEQGPGAKQGTAVGQNEHFGSTLLAAGVPYRYPVALLSVLCVVLLGSLIPLGVLYRQNSNRSDSLEEESRDLAVSLSAVMGSLKNCCAENVQPVQSEMALMITGTPKPNPVRFEINVGQSAQMIALHFDLRFNVPGTNPTIILDSFANGSWQDRRREYNFPLVTGKVFQVTISITNSVFRIILPDGRPVTFPNHLGHKRYDYLSMKGDVTIHRISRNQESVVDC